MFLKVAELTLQFSVRDKTKEIF